MPNSQQIDPLLAEQIAYYRAIAGEYEDHAIPGPGEGELYSALDAFRPAFYWGAGSRLSGPGGRS